MIELSRYDLWSCEDSGRRSLSTSQERRPKTKVHWSLLDLGVGLPRLQSCENVNCFITPPILLCHASVGACSFNHPFLCMPFCVSMKQTYPQGSLSSLSIRGWVVRDGRLKFKWIVIKAFHWDLRGDFRFPTWFSGGKRHGAFWSV